MKINIIKESGQNNKENNDTIATFFVCGDFCPAAVPSDILLKKITAKSIFGGLQEIINTSDISITNLECPITSSKEKIKKIGPNLKTDPEIATLMKEGGFKLVTLANNHILDYGQKGIEDTFSALKENELSYVGAGLNLKEAKKTFYMQIKGIKVAIVNFAEVEYSCANQEHGGANPMNLIDNFNQIQEARIQADYVFVIVHGGHEHHHYPSPETLKRYRFFAEAGAAAVIAHHTHCLGGYERYKEVPIFYSLGNFFFPMLSKMPNRWYSGYAVLFKISTKSLDFEIFPYMQCTDGAWSIDVSQSEAIMRKIQEINCVLRDEALINAKWKKFVEERQEYYLTKISGFGRYKTAILRKLSLSKYFYRKSQHENVRQMLRCEAHKEVALEVLSKYLKK